MNQPYQVSLSPPGKRGNPRAPRHLIAQGTVTVVIQSGSVVVRDDYGLVVHIHDARAVILREQTDTTVYGAEQSLELRN